MAPEKRSVIKGFPFRGQVTSLYTSGKNNNIRCSDPGIIELCKTVLVLTGIVISASHTSHTGTTNINIVQINKLNFI